MPNSYNLLKPILFAMPPEAAHNLSLFALKKNLVGKQEIFTHKSLNSKIFDIEFQNPVGLAPGFDKNAEAIKPLSRQNFGFIEVGTTTPVAQKGNKKPRIFRIKKEKAIINRLGFNNDGVELFSQQLRQWKYSTIEQAKMVVGANIGRNKNSPNNSSDYIKCLEKIYGLCDYVTINISSPNTPNLRDLQQKEYLDDFISSIVKKRNSMKTKYKGSMPLLLKISPDETDEKMKDIADVVLKNKIDGVIVSNTSVNKEGIIEDNNFAENKYQGGLSGEPIFSLSTQKLGDFYKLTKGKIPLIGVGGISSAEDAYEKIKNGASLVQAYTGFVYNGFGLVNEINKGLVKMLKKDKFKSISEAVGANFR